MSDISVVSSQVSFQSYDYFLKHIHLHWKYSPCGIFDAITRNVLSYRYLVKVKIAYFLFGL